MEDAEEEKVEGAAGAAGAAAVAVAVAEAEAELVESGGGGGVSLGSGGRLPSHMRLSRRKLAPLIRTPCTSISAYAALLVGEEDFASILTLSGILSSTEQKHPERVTIC
jgi:hypothetical protein